MIQSKSDYEYYLEADRIALSIKIPSNRIKLLLFKAKQFLYPYPNAIWEFEKTLRKLEYYQNCKRGIIPKLIIAFTKIKYWNLSYKLGFTVPVNTCGPGLALPHHGSIVINTNAVIGENCLIHCGVNIGTQSGYRDRAPHIGNNCYIGPGAKLFGAINIPNNTAIGANAVVNKSFEEEHTTLVGIPAEVKRRNVETFNFVCPATLILKYGLHKKYNIYGTSALKIKELLKSDSRIYKY